MCPYCKDRKTFSGVGPCICTIGHGSERGPSVIKLPKHISAEEGARISRYARKPTAREDCVHVQRPCPFVSCKYNLYLDVLGPRTLKFNFPHLTPDQMTKSCALDVAAVGGATLEEVGAYSNLTRERVRQIELYALRHLVGRMGPFRD